MGDERGRHRVVALALPEVVAFDLSIAAQIFGHREESDRYSFTVCAPHPGPVPSSTGFSIDAPFGLEGLGDADTVIVPGFHPLDVPDRASLRALGEVAARGVRIASVCVGAFALAQAGLLDGLAATTHWEYAEQFRARYPRVRLNADVLYVDQGQLLTSAGISAGIDLCLHIVRLDHGQNAAARVARRMVVATHRTGGQAQYAQRPLPPDGGLGSTREWALAQLQRPLTVEHLARHAGLPVRSFARQFHSEVGMTPMRWLTAQRVLEAQRLLEATRLSVDDIAEHCGFGSATTLRTHFAREVGATPTAYRGERSTAGSAVDGVRTTVGHGRIPGLAETGRSVAAAALSPTAMREDAERREER